MQTYKNCVLSKQNGIYFRIYFPRVILGLEWWLFEFNRIVLFFISIIMVLRWSKFVKKSVFRYKTFPAVTWIVCIST